MTGLCAGGGIVRFGLENLRQGVHRKRHAIGELIHSERVDAGLHGPGIEPDLADRQIPAAEPNADGRSSLGTQRIQPRDKRQFAQYEIQMVRIDYFRAYRIVGRSRKRQVVCFLAMEMIDSS